MITLPRPLFNELLNRYAGQNALRGRAFSVDNHPAGVTPQPCRSPRRPTTGRMIEPMAARQEKP